MSINGDGLLLRGIEGFLGLISDKIFHVVDDGDVKRTTWAPSDLFTLLQLFHGDLEEVSARTRVCIRLKLFLPLHILDLHVIIRSPVEINLVLIQNMKYEPQKMGKNIKKSPVHQPSFANSDFAANDEMLVVAGVQDEIAERKNCGYV
nr:Protein MEI2-like 1 [Ipomoea trifida]